MGIPFSAKNETSGKIGNCQWTLNGTILTISGSGSLDVEYGRGPWGKFITEVKINEGITSLSAGAFADSSRLYKVTLPSSLKTIGTSTFANCYTLNTITIPNGVTKIENHAFMNCLSLTKITLPNSVTSLGFKVFTGCKSLSNILVESKNQSFISVGGILFSKDMSVLVKYPANRSILKYTVPDSVKEIAPGAFEDAYYLTNVILHDGIIKIGANAFFKTNLYNDMRKTSNGCLYIGKYLIVAMNKNVTFCNIKEGTTLIADSAFVACDKIKEINLPEGLQYIGENAFSDCSSLESIYIPSSIKRIEKDAFYNCCSLENVFYQDTSTNRKNIIIGSNNLYLTSATWEYNCCHGGKEHNFKSEVTTKKATCYSDGEKQITCSECNIVITEKIISKYLTFML